MVERVWNFNMIFTESALRQIASLAYTKGSLEESNFAQVVEINERVVGFLFGRNAKKPLFKNYFFFKLNMLWRLIWYPGQKTARDNLLTAIKTHIKNRSVIVERGKSEILLFVVDPEYQGQGFGEKLWSKFKEACLKSGVESIYVSTNTSGATGFYHSMGFRHLGDFCSPLHEIVQWEGRPCMYVYSVKGQAMRN